MYLEIWQKKGILRMGDLISDNNEIIVKSDYKLRELNISPLDIFRLISVIDAIRAEWCEPLSTSAPISKEPLLTCKMKFNGEIALNE